MSNEDKEVVPERKVEIRPFYLERSEDESGISGTGVVAIGAELPSGKCVLEWRTLTSSVAIYNSIADVATIHGHNGKTKVVYGNPEDSKEKPKRKAAKKKVAKK